MRNFAFAFAILCLMLTGCKAVPPKPDFVLQLKNVGAFCPSDDTRNRIRSSIMSGINSLADKDIKAFLAGATIEDNVVEPLGMCPSTGCHCPSNAFRLGVWRNNLDGTGAFVATSSDRVNVLTGMADLAPADQSFAAYLDRRFLDDIVNAKWTKLPKRYNSGGNPDPSGDVELQNFTFDYPDSSHAVLQVNGQYHGFNDPEFHAKFTDTVGVATNSQTLTCQTNKDMSADTSLLDAMSAFFIPFFLEREANDPNALDSLFGISQGLEKAAGQLPLGPVCAGAAVFPTIIPIPRTSFGTKDTTFSIAFQYTSATLSANGTTQGLLAVGQIGLVQRNPTLTVRGTSRDGKLLWSPFVWSPGVWFDVQVSANDYGARRVAFNMLATTTDMRDPVVTWTLQPITWSLQSQVVTGSTAALGFEIGTSAHPGDIGYAQLWVQAVDADGVTLTAGVPVRATIANCCDPDMFNDYFNQICARQVGVNREKCPLPQ